MLLPVLFPQWYLSIALIIPACSLSRGQTLSSVLSTVQPVLSYKADCHPGIVLELETVLFLHADLLLDVCCAKRCAPAEICTLDVQHITLPPDTVLQLKQKLPLLKSVLQAQRA